MEWVACPLTILWILVNIILIIMTVSPYFAMGSPIVQNFINYGKLTSSENDSSKIELFKYLEMPKRYFTHFYIFATLFYSTIAYIFFGCYWFNISSADLVINFLNLITSDKRQIIGSYTSANIVMCLLLFQVWKRLYECLFVNVFSNSKINFFHYVFGFTFYILIMFSLLAESPGFSNKNDCLSGTFTPIRWYNLLGVLMYFVATYNQMKSAQVLSNLRKNKKGEVQHYQYKLPVGHWFRYVSCPHMFCEILIYLAVNITLGGAYRFMWLGFTAVSLNQILVAMLTHKWYKETYPNYPKDRKAIIPYIL